MGVQANCFPKIENWRMSLLWGLTGGLACVLTTTREAKAEDDNREKLKWK